MMMMALDGNLTLERGHFSRVWPKLLSLEE